MYAHKSRRTFFFNIAIALSDKKQSFGHWKGQVRYGTGIGLWTVGMPALAVCDGKMSCGGIFNNSTDTKITMIYKPGK